MSDCCGNPGVGVGNLVLELPDYETFNPGEVRLYGRPALGKIDVSISDDVLDPLIKTELENSSKENLKDIGKGVQAVKELLGKYEEWKIQYRKRDLITLSAPDGCQLYVDVNI